MAFNSDRRSGSRPNRSNNAGYNKRTGEFDSRGEERSRGGNREGYRGSRDGERRGGYGGRDRRYGGFRGERDSDRRQVGRGRDQGRAFDRRDERGGDRRFDRRGERGFERRGEFGPRSDFHRDERRGDERRGDRRDERRDSRQDTRRGGKRDFYGAGRSDAGRRHAQRGGRDRDYTEHTGPLRSGYREERIAARQQEPPLPFDAIPGDLDPTVLQDLKGLAKDNAEKVAAHMVAAVGYMNDDIQLALQHARAAKDRAGRVGVVRETLGIVAYHAGEWKEALSELRAARRINGNLHLIAVEADAERGLGNPAKAIEFARTFLEQDLDEATRVELAIVIAGARQDMGNLDGAILELEPYLDLTLESEYVASRLCYAYGQALYMAERKAESRKWFQLAADYDKTGELDGADRVAEIDQELKS